MAKKEIVFVHGFPYDSSMWDKVINLLGDDFICHAPLTRGLGKDYNGDGQFTIETLTNDLIDYISTKCKTKPVLCGLSMGGYIALRFAERFEDQIEKLILLDTKAEADGNEAKLKRAAGIDTINNDGLETFVSQFIPNCFDPDSIVKLGVEYEAILTNSFLFSPTGVKGCLLAMAARTDSTEYLSKCTLPVLVLCGENDKLSPVTSMKGMSEKIKGSKFVVVPKVGHMTPIEAPEFVAEQIRKFV